MLAIQLTQFQLKIVKLLTMSYRIRLQTLFFLRSGVVNLRTMVVVYAERILQRDNSVGRGQLKCDDTRTETTFLLSVKRTSPFKTAGASVQSTTGSRCVHVSGSNAGYTMFQGSVKGTGYPFPSPVSPSIPLQCITVCHHISTGVYND